MRDAIILAIKLLVHQGICPTPAYYPEPAMIEGHAVVSDCPIPFTSEMPLRAVIDLHIEELAARNDQ